MLNIIVENQTGGSVRVRLQGRLDTSTYAKCEAALLPLLPAATKALMLEMSGVDYLSSMGLRVLMQTSRTLSKQGSKCLLLNMQMPVRKVIEVANALPREAIFSSFEEADRYLDMIQKKAREEEAGK